MTNQELTTPLVEKSLFGRTADGVAVHRYTLHNSQGMRASIITYGATVTELWAPDRQGNFGDVVLGFDELSDYEADQSYLGCMVGRAAFRIVGGKFDLDGESHSLTINNGRNHAHGGLQGFNKRVWRAEILADGEVSAVRFSLHSPAGDQGYPGALSVAVVFTLTDENELQIVCTAKTDRPTLVNITHHGYFNLTADPSQNVLEHLLQLHADRWIKVRNPNISADEARTVDRTPYDFQSPMRLGARMLQAGENGYDLCYLCAPARQESAPVALLADPASGRRLEVSTSEPAIVLYSGGYLNGSVRGKGGVPYDKYAGLCLESGRPPDAIHHPAFPSVLLMPDSQYRHRCSYKFSTFQRWATDSMDCDHKD